MNIHANKSTIALQQKTFCLEHPNKKSFKQVMSSLRNTHISAVFLGYMCLSVTMFACTITILLILGIVQAKD